MKLILLLCIIQGALHAAKDTPLLPQDAVDQYQRNPCMIPLAFDLIHPTALSKYRDDHGNNLMHLAVLSLIQHQDDTNFNALVERSKFLFIYFKKIGININAKNRDGESSVFLAQRHEKTAPFAQQFLTNRIMGGVSFEEAASMYALLNSL